MAADTSDAHLRATARLERLQREASTRNKAVAEYEAEGKTARARMAKLKEQRLAKEAADALVPKPAPKRARAAAKVK